MSVSYGIFASPIQLLLVTLTLLPLLQAQLNDYPYNVSIRIDCGGSVNFTNQYNQSWVSDIFYTGGERALVSEPDAFVHLQERSLRYFPITTGKKNCYIVDVPNGRYLIKFFFVYDNYNHRRRPPSFDVSVEATIVFSWRYPWSDADAKYGVYSDLYAFIEDGDASICFYSIATDSPVIGALEIIQVDPHSYSSTTTGKHILVNYGRLTGGPKSFGAGVSNDIDHGDRAWESDVRFSSSLQDSATLVTKDPIRNANLYPNYFPERLYQTAHSVAMPGSIEYLFMVDPNLDYMLWFHFAEIDPRVNGPGERVFDIIVNGIIAYHDIDICKAVGKYAAYDLQYIARNLSGSSLNVTFNPSHGAPLVSAIENYALLLMDLTTDSNEVLAMRALKESLQIPERMGWNGDPCAPSGWDAWEGVSCSMGTADKIPVVTHLDLSGQGLKGSISEKIIELRHLISLNFSNNKIQGSIMEGLGSHALKIVDLSFNSLTGHIPESLGRPQLQKVLLNNNQLDGQVPLALYTIGVKGGFINLTSNKGLCGVPALPSCPHFWEKAKLSLGAKVGIAFATASVAVVLISLICIAIKRNDDYSFDLAHQLASKSTRYQRQKTTPKFDGDDSQSLRSRFGFSPNLTPL